MATNIQLVTYAGQTVTPLDDSLIYENALTNGIIYGCECTLVGGNTIHMAGGHGVICGRKFTVYESDTAVPLSSSGTLNGRMKVHLDLADTGEPIKFVIESSASLPALVQQDDVNVSNGIYEFNMCTFNVTTTAVTNFAQVFPTAYPADREISSYGATSAQLASGDKILVQKANGDTYSMSYSALIDSLAATLITRSGTVTDAKHALSAAENNPNVSNTLAAKISQLNSRINDYLNVTDIDTYDEFIIAVMNDIKSRYSAGNTGILRATWSGHNYYNVIWHYAVASSFRMFMYSGAQFDLVMIESGNTVQHIYSSTFSKGTLTFSSAIASSNSALIKKHNNFLELYCDFTVGSSNIPAWTSFITLPTGYRPSANTQVVPNMYVVGGSISTVYLILFPDGRVTCSGQLNANTRYFLDALCIY